MPHRTIALASRALGLAAGFLVPAVALAQTTTPPPAPPPPGDQAKPPQKEEPRQPKFGDFDAGGQLRFPSGPDENGQYATFNWVAVDLKGRLVLGSWGTVDGKIPVAIIRPDSLPDTRDPKLIGGISATLDLHLPDVHTPFAPKGPPKQAGLLLTGAYMREGAMLLSDADFPIFVGDFEPGFATGLRMQVQLGSVVDFSMIPVYLHQSGTSEGIDALQLPTSLILRIGSLVKLSAELGMYTGDDFSFRGKGGGRLATGGSLTVKIGPIQVHAGAGFASLLTGGFYPTVRDSLYTALDVKYVK